MSRIAVVCLTFVLVVGAFAGTAAGDVHETEIQTEYDGGSADSNQGINTTLVLSPAESDLSDIEIRISEQEAIIDDTSYDVSVAPEVDLQEVRPGHYTIEELGVEQEVSISFTAYPRDIKSEELDVGFITYEFFDGGQTDQETVTADTSDSPWFQLQDAQETVDDQAATIDGLEQRVDRLSVVGQITDIAFVGGVVVGLLGIAVAAVATKRTGSKLAKQREEHAKKVESLANRASSEEDVGMIKDTVMAIREGDTDSGGGLGSILSDDDGDDGDEPGGW